MVTTVVWINETRESEARRSQGGASRARSGEQNASKGNFIHIVPLNPGYEAGLAGHAPVKKDMKPEDLRNPTNRRNRA